METDFSTNTYLDFHVTYETSKSLQILLPLTNWVHLEKRKRLHRLHKFFGIYNLLRSIEERIRKIEKLSGCAHFERIIIVKLSTINLSTRIMCG